MFEYLYKNALIENRSNNILTVWIQMVYEEFVVVVHNRH